VYLPRDGNHQSLMTKKCRIILQLDAARHAASGQTSRSVTTKRQKRVDIVRAE